MGARVADAKWRFSAGTPVLARVPGWDHPVELRAGTSDYEVFLQLVLYQELAVPLQPAPQRIIDGGANFGLASLTFSHRWPDAAIVAIELERGNFELATRNCASRANIDVRHAALWGSSGRVAVANRDAAAHSFRAAVSDADESVRAYRVGELLDELGWDTVDVVKLDIEGAERSVLLDARAWLPRVRHLLVELHDDLEPGCTAAFKAALADDDWKIHRQGEYLLASRRNG